MTSIIFSISIFSYAVWPWHSSIKTWIPFLNPLSMGGLCNWPLWEKEAVWLQRLVGKKPFSLYWGLLECLIWGCSLKDPRTHVVWNPNDMKRPLMGGRWQPLFETVVNSHMRWLQWAIWASGCSVMRNSGWELPLWAQSTNRNVRKNNKSFFKVHFGVVLLNGKGRWDVNE